MASLSPAYPRGSDPGRAGHPDLSNDLFLPTLLFMALGGMTWAVRGCSGFGAVAGCIFAGVMWGAGWWYIAHDPRREQSRRYASGWIVLAMTVGVGLAGARGWMQWPSFFEGKLMTNAGKNEYVPIPRSYGFLWLFLAGVPWAGLGACTLAWCGSLRDPRVWHWAARIGCGVGGFLVARYLYATYPELFLPLYDSLKDRYDALLADPRLRVDPSLRRLINDCGAAVNHLGWYLGFLLYEVLRRDAKNVVLILTVGLLNGAGWALCQNWKWAPGVWPTGKFNWWRCWESSGGLSIGLAYGIAYFLVNRRMSAGERAIVASRRSIAGPNFEWLLVYFGLTAFLATFLQFQTGGWGSDYFSVAALFGAGYYFMNRATPADAAGKGTRGGFRLEAGAVLITALLIAGFFVPTILRAAGGGGGRGMGRRDAAAVRAPEATGAGATDRPRGGVRPFESRVPDNDMAATIRTVRRYMIYYPPAVIALGLVWYFARRRFFEDELLRTTPPDGDPNLERWGLYVGVLTGLGLSIRNGLKGWFNIYRGNEDFYSAELWKYLGPLYLVALIALAGYVLFRPRPRNGRGDVFPDAYAVVWLVLIVQNVIAQLITGPLTEWTEMAFSIYYVLLFLITAAIVMHYHFMKRYAAP